MTRRRRLALLLAPLLLFAGSCAADAPQDTMEPRGPIARSIDNLSNGVFLTAIVVFVLVEAMAIVVMVRFRRRHDDSDDDLPAQTHGNFKLEILWTIVPAVLLGVVAVFTLFTLFDITARNDEDLTVQVTGQQWWWEYTYDTDGDGEFTDEDVLTANDLVIPAGQDVNLDIESNDVIHSYWIPALNGKKDAVPGRTHNLQLHADDPGTYIGQCTEFCGLSHAYMRQRVIAMSEGDFDAWLEAQQPEADMPADSEAAAGAQLFATQCSGCHLARGINDEEFEQQGEGRELIVAGNAPDLTHFASRGVFAGGILDLWVDQDGDDIVEADEIGGEFNRGALEAWLRNPPAEKPMEADGLPEPGGQRVRGMPNLNLAEDQIDQLADFLETLE